MRHFLDRNIGPAIKANTGDCLQGGFSQRAITPRVRPEVIAVAVPRLYRERDIVERRVIEQ